MPSSWSAVSGAWLVGGASVVAVEGAVVGALVEVLGADVGRTSVVGLGPASDDHDGGQREERPT